MKLTNLILLIILLSIWNAHALFAQVDNQNTEYKLKEDLEAISYRLEEAKNKSTGYRGKSIGLKTAELSSKNFSFQIARQAKNSKNCKLLAINCNNREDNLDCYLMMDPEKLKNIEEGIENLEGVSRSSGKATLSPPTVVNKISATHSPLGSNLLSAAISRKGVEATAIALTEESEEGTDISKFFEDETCDNIYMTCFAKVAARSLAERQTAEGISQAAKEWAAARHMAAEEERDFNKACEEAKKETERAAKKLASADVILHGKTYADEAFYNWQVKELAEKLAEARVTTAHETLNAIDVINTEQQKKVEVRLNLAIEKERKAFEALVAATANTSKKQYSDSSSSDKQDQVTPITPGKDHMREQLRDEPNQSSINRALDLPVTPQSPTFFISPKPPTSEYKTAAAAHSFVDPSIPMAEAVEIFSDNITKIDYERVEKEKTVQELTAVFEIEKEKEGEKKITSLVQIETDKKLMETWKAMQAEMKEKSKRAYNAGKTEEETHWNNASNACDYASLRLEKAIKAEAAGKSELAQQWREVAEQYKSSVEPYTKSARAYEEGKIDAGKNWYNTGFGFYGVANKLEKAINAKSVGKPEVALQWCKAAECSKRLAEFYSQAAIAYEQGKKEIGDSWNKAGHGFDYAVKELEKAIEVECAGNPEMAQKWRDAAERHKNSVDPYIQAAIAYEQGRKEIGESLYNTGRDLYWAANAETNGIERGTVLFESALQEDIQEQVNEINNEILDGSMNSSTEVSLQPTLRKGVLKKQYLVVKGKLEEIVQPLCLDEVMEELGKSFLEKEKSERIALGERMVDITKATEEDHLRWNAREKADRFAVEATRISFWAKNIATQEKTDCFSEKNIKPAISQNFDNERLTTSIFEKMRWNSDYTDIDNKSCTRSRNSSFTDNNNSMVKTFRKNSFANSRNGSFTDNDDNTIKYIRKNSFTKSHNSSFIDNDDNNNKLNLCDVINADFSEKTRLRQIEVSSAINNAITAEKEWRALAHLSEMTRVGNKEVIVNEEIAIASWLKADRAAIAVRSEYNNIKKEEERAIKLKQIWSSDSVRWEVRAEADKEGWEWDCEEAKVKWSDLADLHPSVTVVYDQGEKAVKYAKQKLKEDDRAVNALWAEIVSRYNESKCYESPRTQEARINQEIGAFKVELLSKKEADITRYFKNLDTITYGDNYDDTLNACRKKYMKTAERNALQAIRKKINGTMEAWELRVKKATDAQKKAELTKSASSFDLLSNNERIVRRMTVIEEADKIAFEALKKEEERLADIEATWLTNIKNAAKSYAQGDPAAWLALACEERNLHNSIITFLNRERQELTKMKEEMATQKAERTGYYADKMNKLQINWSNSKQTAVKNADKAKVELERLMAEKSKKQIAQQWGKFFLKEREAQKKDEIADAALQRAQAISPEQRSAFESAWREVDETAKIAESSWAVVAKAYSDGLLKDESIESTLTADLKKAEYCQMYWTAELFLRQAQKADIVAQFTLKKAQELHAEQDFTFEENWRKAIEAAQDAKAAWEKSIDPLQDVLDRITPELQFDWNIKLYQAKNIQAERVAEVLWIKAQKLDKIGIATLKKAKTTNFEDRMLFETAWNKAIETAEFAELAWKEAMEAQKGGQERVPQECKLEWTDNLNKAKQYYARWNIEVLWRQSQKVNEIAKASLEKAKSTTVQNRILFETAWKDARDTAKTAKTAWKETAEALKNGLQQVAPEFQLEWKKNLHVAKQLQTNWGAVAKKSSSDFSSCVIN